VYPKIWTCSYILAHFFARGLFIALMMDAVRTSETLVSFYQTMRCYIPEDSHSHKVSMFVDAVNLENLLYYSVTFLMNAAVVFQQH
jgi:hypothetical protein